jgi:hypothetical protein
MQSVRATVMHWLGQDLPGCVFGMCLAYCADVSNNRDNSFAIPVSVTGHNNGRGK